MRSTGCGNSSVKGTKAALSNRLESATVLLQPADTGVDVTSCQNSDTGKHRTQCRQLDVNINYNTRYEQQTYFLS